MTILHQPGNVVRAAWADSAWRQEMRRAIRDPAELCRILGLDAKWAIAAQEVAGDFGLFVPRPLIGRMRPGDPADPLLLQVLPRRQEQLAPPGFELDPLREASAQAAPGLLLKYRGRALLVATGVCAVHCRYCFRRHYPYAASNPRADHWDSALNAIAADDSMEEVILSGGDPLTLDDDVLGDLTRRLAEIPQLQRLRIHTRLPIMIPQRVTDSLLDWLCGGRLTPVVVLHANHANELDADVGDAVARIADSGAMLLNQAVWLRDVNDNTEAQIDLSRRLLQMRVLPYYLHMLDPVVGAAHFAASERRARGVIAAMRSALPGYGVPRLAREIPGEPSKTILM